MKHAMSAAKPRRQRDEACSRGGAIDRWELLSLVVSLRKELGLTDRDVMVLRAHLSVLPQGPLSPGALNMSFMQLSELQNRACGMDERRFRRGEAQLAARGLIVRCLSANGRRFPERTADGRIIAAYGIDLSPVIARYQELSTLQTRLEDEARALKQRKNGLSARLASLQRQMAPSDSLTTLMDNTRNAFRRKTTTMSDLDALETEIAALENTLEPVSTARCPVPENSLQPDRTPGDAGQTVRHIESERKDIYTTTFRLNPSQIRNVWQQSSSLIEFYPETPPTEHEAKARIIEFGSFIGLGRDCVDAALLLAGLENTIRVVDYLSKKIDTVSKPRAYLKSILAKLLRGETVAAGSAYLPYPIGVQRLPA
ncbi:helix-turn-helix domain-containing protein [Salipiger sp. 1_MG-2023]|uniref:helix-turn-helix domain-containing protein n=1 Tax=Salipiger sp. 1_MG-2023 TaxID=3062665 RepID=UPI0026E1F321|nr:helix-turn-helix domain-containing protein [Salipiger sp. 1_MG-2023]MDO6588477.1 helix-turn-helix domain-containing protein [Salipiger sp. 1_MG-2023]